MLDDDPQRALAEVQRLLREAPPTEPVAPCPSARSLEQIRNWIKEAKLQLRKPRD
jgi:hypothetical protein